MSYTVSVISASFNDSHFAEELYNSLQEQLENNTWEWIIVNDGSEQKHTAFLDQFVANKANIQLHHIKNGGPAKARDFGIERATAEIMLVIDIDDIALTDQVKNGIALLQKEKFDIVVGDCIEFYEDGAPDHYWVRGPIDIKKMLYRNQWVISNLFTKAIWRQAGGFTTKENFPREDYLFWTKCLAAGAAVGYLAEPFIRYRRKTTGSRNAKKRTYRDKLLLHRALYDHQKMIAQNRFSGKKQRQLSALADANLGYHEAQTGDMRKGLQLLFGAFARHPKKLNVTGIILKSLPKRLLRIVRGKA